MKKIFVAKNTASAHFWDSRLEIGQVSQSLQSDGLWSDNDNVRKLALLKLNSASIWHCWDQTLEVRLEIAQVSHSLKSDRVWDQTLCYTPVGRWLSDNDIVGKFAN